jgi:hypothetical protein
VDQAFTTVFPEGEENIMRTRILGTLLAGGLTFALATPADAQMTFSLGQPGSSPSVSVGQPQYNSSYYGQPAYNGGYAAPANGYYGQNTYSNGYYPRVAPSNGYYAPAPRSSVYTRQPTYGVPRYSTSPNPYVGSYPPATIYNSGYQGIAPTPGYYPNAAYRSYGYGNQGVNVNIPRLGPVNIR